MPDRDTVVNRCKCTRAYYSSAKYVLVGLLPLSKNVLEYATSTKLLNDSILRTYETPLYVLSLVCFGTLSLTTSTRYILLLSCACTLKETVIYLSLQKYASVNNKQCLITSYGVSVNCVSKNVALVTFTPHLLLR